MAEERSTLDADRVPPQDLEAETATLGAMLLGGEATEQVVQILTEADFYRDAHRAVFAACSQLYSQNEPVDTVSVADALRKADKFESVGGWDGLDRLTRNTPYSTNAVRYARIVKEKATLRALLFASQTIAQTCYNPQTTAAQALDEAESRIMGLASARGSFDFEHLHPISMRVYEMAERNYERGGEVTGISTGYPDLDRYLSGLQRGDLVILAARPSMGKTSLAVNFAMHASQAKPEPTPVGLFSLEMGKEQVVGGMICTQAQVNLSRWRSGNLRSDDWSRIAEAMNDLAQAPMYIDDTPALSPMAMRAKARRLKAEHGLGLLVVDYLQLMAGDGRTPNRTEEISQITRSLKGLAKELDVPLVALAQLSRAVEQRQDKRPMLSDLRESGQIEADADVVMFLYRESYYQQKEDDGAGGSTHLDDSAAADETEVIISKQRNGPTGAVKLGFQPQFKRFVSWDEHYGG